MFRSLISNQGCLNTCFNYASFRKKKLSWSIGSFGYEQGYIDYYCYMPTAHSLLWLVRWWSHDHLTKLILRCNTSITFQHSDFRFMGSILNFKSWKGTQQNWTETRNSKKFVKSWLGRELGKHISKLNRKIFKFLKLMHVTLSGIYGIFIAILLNLR